MGWIQNYLSLTGLQVLIFFEFRFNGFLKNHYVVLGQVIEWFDGF